MHKLTILSLVLTSGLFAAGCGSSTSGGTTFSCDYTIAMIHQCAEYDNLPAADQSTESSACTGETGTAGTGCSTTNSLGSCAYDLGGISYKEFYYSDGGETAAEASMACTTGSGTWTAT